MTNIQQTLSILDQLADVPLLDECITNERMAVLALAGARQRGETMTMTELAKTIRVSRAALTSLVDRLGLAGVARRVRVEGDRRTMHVVLDEDVFGAVVAALDERQAVAA